MCSAWMTHAQSNASFTNWRRKKWRKTRRAILLFVLSTKVTKDRFLLRRCQRNGNLKTGTFSKSASGACQIGIHFFYSFHLHVHNKYWHLGSIFQTIIQFIAGMTCYQQSSSWRWLLFSFSPKNVCFNLRKIYVSFFDSFLWKQKNKHLWSQIIVNYQ